MVATAETDAALRKEYRKLGNRARRNDVKREDCPCDGLCKNWWLEGWDGEYSDITIAQ